MTPFGWNYQRVQVPLDVESVESVGPEGDPQDAGTSRAAVYRVRDRARDLFRTGVYPGMSVCVRRRGETLLYRGWGHLRGNEPGALPDAEQVPLRYDSPFNLFSASKAITAMVIHQLDERGIIHLDDPVEEWIPGFGRNGKRWITIRHVLTHRAGIPSVPGTANDLELLRDWNAVIEAFAHARPVSRPGRRLSYHAISGGFVLGEVVRQATGRRIEDWLRDELLGPIGLGGMTYGLGGRPLDAVARNAFTGPPVPLALDLVIRRALGAPFSKAIEISNDPRFLQGIVPAGNVIGNAWQTARFYEMLLMGGELDGVRVLQRRTVRRATVESSWLEMDFTLVVPVRYGLGLMLGSDPVGLFGPRTRHAYGHLGFMNVLAWADPDRDLAVAILTSGKPFVSPHIWRLWRLLEAIGDLHGLPTRSTAL